VKNLPIVFGFSLLIAVVASHSQTQHARNNKPSAPQPDSCAFPLIALNDATGSKAYVRLRYLIAALDSAQDAVSRMASSLKEFNTATTTASALAPLITGTDGAKDALHCAAFIMNQYPGSDEDEKLIKAVSAAASIAKLTQSSISWLTSKRNSFAPLPSVRVAQRKYTTQNGWLR
jgi:hypothetical protein